MYPVLDGQSTPEGLHVCGLFWGSSREDGAAVIEHHPDVTTEVSQNADD